MDTVFKNILICGVAVFFVVGLFAFIQLQSSQTRIAAAERAAAELGLADARSFAKTGERFLLAAAYGWGPGDIPGFDRQLYGECLADLIELRVFKDFGDLPERPGPEGHYQKLTEQPKTTRIYAESFNREVLRLLPSSTITGCRIPKR